MTRPTLANHETRLALLEQGRAHDGEHDEAVLSALQEIRDEMRELNKAQNSRIAAVEAKHTELDTAIKVAAGTARGIGIGWAAAFTFLGGAIATVVANITGLFR